MDAYEINELFSSELKINKVEDHNEIEFNSYDEFLTLYEEGKIDVFIYYQTQFVEILGDEQEQIYHITLMLIPVALSLLSIILSIVFRNLHFLFGIFTSILGLLIALPFVMRGFISKLFFCVFGLSIYFLIMGEYVNFFIASSYLISHFFVSVARHQCRILVNTALTIRQKVFFGAQVIDAPWWASSPATT